MVHWKVHPVLNSQTLKPYLYEKDSRRLSRITSDRWAVAVVSMQNLTQKLAARSKRSSNGTDFSGVGWQRCGLTFLTEPKCFFGGALAGQLLYSLQAQVGLKRRGMLALLRCAVSEASGSACSQCSSVARACSSCHQ
eukprot:394892-Amphidinium_carterae.1